MDLTERQATDNANTRLSATEARLVRQVVDVILQSPIPASAIAHLVNLRRNPHASPFERYAGTVLNDAGAQVLVSLPPRRSVRLIPPDDGHLARLIAPGDASVQELATIQDVEGAINRLCSIADAVADSGEYAAEPKTRTITISFIGGAFTPERPSYRSANIAMPAIGRAERPPFEYFNEVDWRALDHVAIIAHNVFQRCILPNMHQAFMGASAPADSDWDIRTRLAATLEKLELPLHFDYRFDCDIERKSAAVRFTAPSERALPQLVTSRAGSLESIGDRAIRALQVYTVRLACLLAAACFGSGRVVDEALVQCDLADGRPAFVFRFTRQSFVSYTLCAIDSGELSSPELRFDPRATLSVARPDQSEILDGEPGSFEASSYGADMRKPAHLDDRELPLEAKRLFHARRICDIDTRHAFGHSAESIGEARCDSNESLIAAIAHLETVIDECERTTTPPDDDASARPLYCSNPLERATVALHDDRSAIGIQAEAYLKGAESFDIDAGDLPFYFRAPDALFQARLGLSDLYSRLGDFSGAEMQANRCLALAPTTAQAYYQKADVLAQQQRYAEAANTLVEGLRFTPSDRDCALLYYHLALVLGKMDRAHDAAAVYVYTTSLSGEYAERAARMVQTLRKKRNIPVITHASPLAAAREMAHARIPIAPTDEARMLVIRAAITLSSANAPVAAAPYAAAIAHYFRNDPIITATAKSIQFGIANN